MILINQILSKRQMTLTMIPFIKAIKGENIQVGAYFLEAVLSS